MASPLPENRVAVSATKLLIQSITSVILCVASVVCAHARDPQQNNTNESWAVTTQAFVGAPTFKAASELSACRLLVQMCCVIC